MGIEQSPEYWNDPERIRLAELSQQVDLLRRMVAENLDPIQRSDKFYEFGGRVIEDIVLTGNSGNRPTTRPYHWLCGIDKQSGDAIDPPGITMRDRVAHFIHSDNQLHGALTGHPLVNDTDKWSIIPPWDEVRKKAIKEATSANKINADEAEVCEPDAVPVGR